MIILVLMSLLVISKVKSELIVESEDEISLELIERDARMLEIVTKPTECDTRTIKTKTFEVLIKEYDGFRRENYTIGNMQLV